MKNTLKEFIPPIALKMIRRLSWKQTGDRLKPDWHTIQSGHLKGINIYVNNEMPAFKEMIAGKYDGFLWKYLDDISFEKSIVLDIGAHIGYHSMGFANKGGNVIAFEPNPYNVERLKKNLSRNERLKERISIMPVAVSDVNEEVKFCFSKNIDDETSTGGYIENSYKPLQDTEYEKAGFTCQNIQAKQLDKFVEENNYENIRVIKIDVEGAEHLVLAGALKTLKKYSPKLFIEIHSVTSMLFVTQILSRLDYHIKIIKEDTVSRCFIMAEKTL